MGGFWFSIYHAVSTTSIRPTGIALYLGMSYLVYCEVKIINKGTRCHLYSMQSYDYLRLDRARYHHDDTIINSH